MITLLLMTLNEIEGMQKIMPRVRREWIDQVLVADGGSTDGTIEWAQQQGYDVVVCPKKGLTNAYLAAWSHIKGDVVIYFSPDGNSIPEAIPRLIQKMREGFDMVIASRFLPPAKSFDDNPITAFGNSFFRWFINVLLKPKNSPKLTDPFVMFRALKKTLPAQLGLKGPEPLDKILQTHSCWIPLLSMRCLKYRLRWTEIPVDEPARIGGKSKLQIFRYGFLHLLQTIREFFSRERKVSHVG